MNKVIYIKSHFVAVGKYQDKRVPTGKKKRGLFGEKDIMRTEKEWVQTGYSKSVIDGKRLSNDIEEAVKKLNNDNYEVVSVIPLTSGEYEYDRAMVGNNTGGAGYGYGYGYSFTEGVVIIAKKI